KWESVDVSHKDEFDYYSNWVCNECHFHCTNLWEATPVESRQMFEIDARIDLEQPEHRIAGLEPVLVAAIPTMKFNHEAFSSMEDAQCTICLGEYQEKEVLRIMPKCGHSFHLSCIVVLLRKQSACPVCRLSVQDSFETKHLDLTNTPEILRADSQQWLLPSGAHSDGNGSNQGHAESVSGNVESIHSGATEAR
ncbi:hypothetical protein RJ640_029593, partial [Escallonia rubra]